jgi:CheY-like chemotaxis protein
MLTRRTTPDHCFGSLTSTQRATLFVLGASKLEPMFGKRVLVVDDQQVIADTTVMILRGHGYEAKAVYSGEEALECASTFRPDVVLLDMIMKNLNGIETSRLLMQQNPECRIILLSGTPETARILKEEHDKGNMIDVLAKPVHPQFLLDTLSGAATALKAS